MISSSVSLLAGKPAPNAFAERIKPMPANRRRDARISILLVADAAASPEITIIILYVSEDQVVTKMQRRAMTLDNDLGASAGKARRPPVQVEYA